MFHDVVACSGGCGAVIDMAGGGPWHCGCVIRREDVIDVDDNGCPICNAELEVSDRSVLPIESKCNNCKEYYDSYHGMGDSFGRAGEYGWGWNTSWDEQAYLAAILKVREGRN